MLNERKDLIGGPAVFISMLNNSTIYFFPHNSVGCLGDSSADLSWHLACGCTLVADWLSARAHWSYPMWPLHIATLDFLTVRWSQDSVLRGSIPGVCQQSYKTFKTEAIRPMSLLSRCIGRSKSRSQPRFKTTENRLHLLRREMAKSHCKKLVRWETLIQPFLETIYYTPLK